MKSPIKCKKLDIFITFPLKNIWILLSSRFSCASPAIRSFLSLHLPLCSFSELLNSQALLPLPLPWPLTAGTGESKILSCFFSRSPIVDLASLVNLTIEDLLYSSEALRSRLSDFPNWLLTDVVTSINLLPPLFIVATCVDNNY